MKQFISHVSHLSLKILKKISRKDSYSPQGGYFCRRKGVGKKNFVSDYSKCIIGHPKGVGGLTSNFLHGGGYGHFLE
jgi:hypothetical protein